LISLLDDLKIEQANLVGYSMGGRVALYLATHYQERFRKVVNESSSAGLKDKAEREARQIEDERRAKRLETSSFEEFLRDWYAQPLFSSVSSRPELFEDLVSMRLSGSPAELAKSLRLMGTGRMEPLWDLLGTLTIPTVCMAGELDPKFAALARQMAVAIPNCHAMIIPYAGHIVHFEQPDIYIARVHSFLSI
jgi:2-succinyl-6-hydroxy-2,4-cyclohexadiene-1-carboxylate synthase